MDKILQKLSGGQKNVLLKNHTTYKIGGPAKYFFVAKSKEDLMAAIKAAKDFKLPIFILGINAVLLSESGQSATHALAAIAGIAMLAFVGLPTAISAALQNAINQ